MTMTGRRGGKILASLDEALDELERHKWADVLILCDTHERAVYTFHSLMDRAQERGLPVHARHGTLEVRPLSPDRSGRIRVLTREANRMGLRPTATLSA